VIHIQWVDDIDDRPVLVSYHSLKVERHLGRLVQLRHIAGLWIFGHLRDWLEKGHRCSNRYWHDIAEEWVLSCIEWNLRRAGGDLKELVFDINSKDERRDALGTLLDGSDKYRWGLIWKLGSGRDNMCAAMTNVVGEDIDFIQVATLEGVLEEIDVIHRAANDSAIKSAQVWSIDPSNTQNAVIIGDSPVEHLKLVAHDDDTHFWACKLQRGVQWRHTLANFILNYGIGLGDDCPLDFVKIFLPEDVEMRRGITFAESLIKFHGRKLFCVSFGNYHREESELKSKYHLRVQWICLRVLCGMQTIYSLMAFLKTSLIADFVAERHWRRS
jgi:hypothetical protein